MCAVNVISGMCCAESGHTSQFNDIITMITKEVRELWTFSCIPMRDYRGCWSIVKQCVSKWAEAKQDMKKSPKFQKDLNTLLDCRPVTCKTLSSLKQALIKTCNTNWGIDYEFFKVQLTYPQTSTMSSTKDDKLRKKVEMKSTKKALSFMERNKGTSLLNQYATEPETTSSHTMISGDNVLEKTTRQSQCTSKLITSEDCSSQDELSNIDSDEDWDVPLRLKRQLKKKTETITLNLPSKCIPTILADTCTTTKNTNRNELKIVSTLFKAGGADINDASLSVSTINHINHINHYTISRYFPCPSLGW